jgi:hypothetical protein
LHIMYVSWEGFCSLLPDKYGVTVLAQDIEGAIFYNSTAVKSSGGTNLVSYFHCSAVS